MRMWMVDPQIMCRQHLLGEHTEMHMFVGTLKRGPALQFVFGTLAILFMLLALGDITGDPGIIKIAGYEGILCGFSAIYLAAAEILNEVYKKKILPT